MPYKWHPENSLYDSMLMWRMLDITESNGGKIDLVIGTKFPSYGAIHSNKVAWVIHQFRQVYDLFKTSHGLSHAEHGIEMKKRVENFDEISMGECKNIFTISNNVSARLLKYNGINSKPLYHPPSMAGRYICEDYSDYILSVGRLDRLKRNELLLRSLCYCDKKIKVKIVGRGPEMENLKDLAVEYKVAKRVEFMGFVSNDDLLQLYSNAFAVFFAPVDEDYGYVTLESFFSRKPIVTCKDSGGVLEFVEDGANGYVCGSSPQEIGAAINELYCEKNKCKILGEMGYDKVKDITWDNVIERLTQTL